MGLSDKLRQASASLRKLRLSFGPDSYAHYKQGKSYERKREDRAREKAEDFADRERATAERERVYGERYEREREGDRARERAEEELKPDR